MVECKIINLLLLLHFLFLRNKYFKKYLPWLITAASPLSLSLVSFFIVTGYCQTVTINTFCQHYCSWRATPNVTQGIKMFLLYLSTSTSCSLTDGSSIVLANTFDLWLDTLIGSGNFVFSCIILLVSLYNSYSSENMSFTQVEGSVTLSGPNSLGNLRALEEQTALYNSFRSASKSIVILDVAYECFNMFVFPTPFLVGRNRRNCSFFDLAFFLREAAGNWLVQSPLGHSSGLQSFGFWLDAASFKQSGNCSLPRALCSWSGATEAYLWNTTSPEYLWKSDSSSSLAPVKEKRNCCPLFPLPPTSRPAAMFVLFVPSTRIFLAKAVYMVLV